jgi:hypothetical protein
MQGLQKNNATPVNQTKPSANKLETHGTATYRQDIHAGHIDRDQIQDSTPQPGIKSRINIIARDQIQES